jgi:hypothetical protein
MESFIFEMPQVRTVLKRAALVLGFLLCCCTISGCLSIAPSQDANTNQKSNFQESQLSLTLASVALGEPASIKATMTDINGKPLDGKVVEWFIDGKSLGKSQSKDGITFMNLTSEYVDNLAYRTHQVQANFYGDAAYESSTATSFLLVTAVGAPPQSP